MAEVVLPLGLLAQAECKLEDDLLTIRQCPGLVGKNQLYTWAGARMSVGARAFYSICQQVQEAKEHGQCSETIAWLVSLHCPLTDPNLRNLTTCSPY